MSVISYYIVPNSNILLRMVTSTQETSGNSNIHNIQPSVTPTMPFLQQVKLRT